MFAHSCSHDKIVTFLHATILWLCVLDNVHTLFLHQMRISSLRINFFYISKLQKKKLTLGNLRKLLVFYVAVKNDVHAVK